MSLFSEILNESLQEALALVRRDKIAIFTVAFYHDHESRAVSICIDTEANSHAEVASENRFSAKYFWQALDEGDLKELRSSNANVGRNLSLGDFTLVNAGRRELPKGKITKDLYLDMIRVLRSKEEEIIGLAVSRERLLFCCSGPNAEVDFWWSAMMAEAKK